MKNHYLKKYVILSILISLACVLAYLDHLLSTLVFAAIPFLGLISGGLKIGFANIIILFIIYRYNFLESLIAVCLKSILISFIFGSMISFLIGFVGTILSFLIMELLIHLFKNEKALPFVSLVGGFTHMFGQLIVVFILYGLYNFEFNTLLIYLPFYLLVGIISGLFVGFIVKPINKHLKLGVI